MPIKPENRARYPKDWKQISADARSRAGNCCEHPGCMARQYAVGSWEKRGGEWEWQPLMGSSFHDAAGQGFSWPSMEPLNYADARQIAADQSAFDEDVKLIVIVLTVEEIHEMLACAKQMLAQEGAKE